MTGQCRHCLHPVLVAVDGRGQHWVHHETGLTRCPQQPHRRRQVAEPAHTTITRADVALAGGDQ